MPFVDVLKDIARQGLIESLPRKVLDRIPGFIAQDEKSLKRSKDKFQNSNEFHTEVLNTLKVMRVFHIVINYNQLELARGQIELAKALWEPQLKEYQTIYVTNADAEAQRTPPGKGEHYFTRENLGHFKGATDLINTGISEAIKLAGQPNDVIIVASADVWQLDPESWMINMWRFAKNKAQFMASTKGKKELTTELFFIKPEFAKQVFPLDYDALAETPQGKEMIQNKRGYVEWILWKKIKEYIPSYPPGSLKLIQGMRIAAGNNRDRFAPEYGYTSSHSDDERRSNFAEMPEETVEKIKKLAEIGKIPTVKAMLKL
jgi:viroplasmin and RNaseH domain-containing protein